MNKTRSALVILGVFLLTKLKWVVGLLKFSKFGTTLLSMLISLWVYAWMYGWKFAAALVYLIFVHEMGHVIAAKRKGIKVSPAVFIPFAGAFIAIKDQPRDAATEAYLAYGGPLAGMLAFLPALPLYWWTHDPFWVLVIYLGALLNLFNLLPVSPLDGGRVVSVLSTKIWLIGLLALGFMMFVSPSPMIVIIFIFGAMTWWSRAREGYRQRVLRYEKEKLEGVLQEIAHWPQLDSSIETRERLSAEKQKAFAIPVPKGFAIPFLQDDKRFVRERIAMDKEYADRIWELFRKWEHEPVLFVDGDPSRPAPSPLLTEAEQTTRQQLARVEEQLHRLTTYYEAPASTKWKLLIAYLALAGVLSAFFVYGQHLLGVR